MIEEHDGDGCFSCCFALVVLAAIALLLAVFLFSTFGG